MCRNENVYICTHVSPIISNIKGDTVLPDWHLVNIKKRKIEWTFNSEESDMILLPHLPHLCNFLNYFTNTSPKSSICSQISQWSLRLHTYIVLKVKGWKTDSYQRKEIILPSLNFLFLFLQIEILALIRLFPSTYEMDKKEEEIRHHRICFRCIMGSTKVSTSSKVIYHLATIYLKHIFS